MIKLIKYIRTPSISKQLIISIALVHAVLMTIFVIDLIQRQKKFLLNQSKEQVAGLSKTTATGSVSWVLARDVVGLQEIVHSLSQHQDLVYAMIVAPNGEILAHTDQLNVGKFLLDSVSNTMLKNKAEPLILVNNKSIIDAASPILVNNKIIGWARVSISRNSISKSLKAISRDGLWYILIALAIGSVYAIFMSKRITLRLRYLVSVANEITAGNENIRIRLKRKDELGKLGDNLNLMIDSIIQQKNTIQNSQEELIRAKEKAEDEEKYTKMLFSSSPIGLALTKTTGELVEVNASYAKIIGYSVEETIKLSYWDITPKKYAEQEQIQLENLKTNGVYGPYEKEYIHKSGKLVPVRLMGKIIYKKGKEYIWSSVEDISKIKETKSELMESEERFRNIFSQSGDGILIIDFNKGIIDCNNAAFQCLLYDKKDDLIGLNPWEISPEYQPDGAKSIDKAKQVMQECFDRGQFQFEWVHLNKVGNPIWFDIVLTKIIIKNKEIFHCVWRDITERKNAEEERFETLARFSGFAEASQYGMGMADFDGNIIYLNSTLVRMLGEKTEKDCIGKHFPTCFYSPDSMHKLENEVIPDLLSKGNWNGELELISVDGRKIPTYENYFIIKDENGTPKYFADILTDITERKTAEKALQESERKLHAIFDHHYQLTGLINIDGRLLAANKTALKYADVDEVDVIGEYFWDGPWWSEDQKQGIINAFKEALEGKFVRFETIHHTSEGGIRNIDFSFNPVKDENNKVIFIVPEGRDITEIRTTESALKENEARLRSLSDHLPGGMTYQLDMGKEGEIRKFTYVSAGVQEIHEISVEEVLNDANILYNQLFEEDLQKVVKLEAQAIANMAPFVAEARFKLPSGEVRWHLITSAPRRISNGHLLWDGVELDITERKKVELELEKYRNHLENMVSQRTNELEEALGDLKDTQAHLIQSEKMASLGILTAGVAHEINNPLNYILGSYTGLEFYFNKKNIKDPKVSLLLKSLKTGVDRAAEIVKGLNDFSRDRKTLEEECDIHSIIDNCLLMLRNITDDKVKINKNYSTTPLLILGNIGRLHQVFINIITNSIHAIKDEGEVSILTQKNKNSVLIEISDTGCGISKENLKRILDPFYTTKDPGKGTGLGLSISYNIIQEHKGTIEIQSEINKGTLVKVTLPL